MMSTRKIKRAPGRPSEKHGTDLTEILLFAIKQFAAKGYGGVSINALAKQVGVADSLFHYHFGSKFELWKGCLNHVSREIIRALEGVNKLSKDLESLERIKLFNNQLVYISARYPEFQQIIVHEVYSESERSIWLIQELLKPIYTIFERNLREAAEKGVIKSIPPANLTSFIIGSITTLFSRSFQMKLLHGINAFDEATIEEHAMIMNDLLLNGLIEK